MANLIFPTDSNAAALLLGIGKRQSDNDRLLTKAFLIGQQAGALQRERLEFLKEQNQSMAQYAQMMALLVSLMQKQGGSPNAPMGMPGGGSEGNPLAGLIPQGPTPPEAGMGGAPQPPDMGGGPMPGGPVPGGPAPGGMPPM